ncbi:MAG: serine/threonine protein kinase [Gemmatimonadota bacterium]|nr:serine/threonine protein kinase [Gemmatimonadota bacterium]
MTERESLPNRPDDALRAQLERVLEANYELDQEIGRGGMGIVYRGRDRRLKRLVAIKLLPPDLAYRADIRSRFLREAETSAQLSHPSIVPIYTVEEADNLVFFIMAYVNGDTIAQRLRQRGPMPPEEVRRILCEVGDALAYANARNVVHRDIKPDNILLDSDTGRAMVTDFGIARAVSEGNDTRLTTTGLAIGTPAYMSPEQCAGDRGVDGRSDIYSLGIVGYQMLCGDLPFAASNTPGMFVKHLTERPRPIAERVQDLPEDLGPVIMRCLAKEPADRFPTATALVDALNGRTSVGPTSNSPYQPRPPAAQAGAPQMARNPTPPRPLYDPTRAVEKARWEAPPVRTFRKKFVTWAGISGFVFLPLGLFGSHEFFVFGSLWGIGIAFSYSKLWNKGYDWRDVFRQPRDALFADVVNERIDDARALFDPQKRDVARERLRARMRDGSGLMTLSPVPGSIASGGTHGLTGFDHGASADLIARFPAVQEAAMARADIQRMMTVLPDEERRLVPDVASSADSLYVRIEQLAAAIENMDRANVPGLGDAIESEINELELQANPLEEDASEERVKRLVQLRRQRVSLREMRNRRAAADSKLSRAMSAMRQLRIDVGRLSTGTRSYESVTQVAEQAMRIGQEVDAVLYAQDEMARVLRRES